MAESKSAEL